jgi:hypothetical protein
VRSAEGSLGFEEIMRGAQQSQIAGRGVATPRKWNDMVELKHTGRAAPNSGGSNEGALTVISHVDLITHAGWNVTLWLC